MIITIYSPYLWYQKTFKTLTKHHFVILMLGKGLLRDVEGKFICSYVPIGDCKVVNKETVKQIIQDITNELLKYSLDCFYSGFCPN